MNILEFFMPVALLAIVGFIGVSYAFSRKPFWQQLHNIYGCSRKEYLNIPELSKNHSRLVFYEEAWESENCIEVKLKGKYLYLGPYRLFSLFIKPIKIPICELIYKGKKDYWLSTRDTYEFKSVYGYKIALREGLIESVSKD